MLQPGWSASWRCGPATEFTEKSLTNSPLDCADVHPSVTDIEAAESIQDTAVELLITDNAGLTKVEDRGPTSYAAFLSILAAELVDADDAWLLVHTASGGASGNLNNCVCADSSSASSVNSFMLPK